MNCGYCWNFLNILGLWFCFSFSSIFLSSCCVWVRLLGSWCDAFWWRRYLFRFHFYFIFGIRCFFVTDFIGGVCVHSLHIHNCPIKLCKNRSEYTKNPFRNKILSATIYFIIAEICIHIYKYCNKNRMQLVSLSRYMRVHSISNGFFVY